MFTFGKPVQNLCYIYMKKVKLIKATTVTQYAKKHANGKIHFDEWLFKMKIARWVEPADINKSYKGNLLGGSSERVIFDLGGSSNNAFRIICKYDFRITKVMLFVCWIGTHEEYNSLTQKDKKTIFVYKSDKKQAK
jgi:mRNA interferase HigB